MAVCTIVCGQRQGKIMDVDFIVAILILIENDLLILYLFSRDLFVVEWPYYVPTT